MKVAEELDALTEGMAARGEQDSLEALGRLLEHLIHDLNNPLGTFGLELYSFSDVCERLTRALDEGEADELARQIEGLKQVQANLADANQTALELLKTIEDQNAARMVHRTTGAKPGQR